ncbi:MAG: sugar phosphate isomerase/epimerase [Lentisphaeria bacterium]|nr:sugar phosphate isomerase/epimerase [Lentisphaeria bacterium]
MKTNAAKRTVPVTFLYDWDVPSDRDRQTVMYEFAANGAKHLVLSDTLIKKIGGTPNLYRQLRSEVAAAGLDFVDAHAPYRGDCDPNCPDPAVRPCMLARLRLTLQIVHDFGVKTCCVHIGNIFYEGYTAEQMRDAVCRTLDAILPLAEELDVTMCLENIFRPLNAVGDVLYFLEKYPSKCLGACFDSGHANILQNGKSIPNCVAHKSFGDYGFPVPWETDVLGRMLPYIVNCHLHDNDASADQHLLPGKGTVDWKALVPKLLSAPHLACIQSEVLPLRAQQPIRPLCEKFAELFGGI